MVTLILRRFPLSVHLLILVVALLGPTFRPTSALAQQPRAGVVTTLQGAATVARAPLPQETPLKFKDDVLYRDRITTKEQSLVRVLLGGKALVTVRELSVFTITEEPGRAVVEMQSGKVAVAVARQLMRPGESIEVRTPNAIAAVRGTVMIVEVSEAAVPGAPGPAVPVTNVHCLSGVCRYGHRGSHVPEQDLPQGFTGAVEGPNVKLPTPSPPGVGQGYGATLQPSNEGQGQAGKKGQDDTAALLNGPPPSTPSPNGTPSKKQENTSDLGTNQNPRVGGGNGGTGANLIMNGGFETGSLAPWTSAGSASVISALGPIAPPDGTKMAKIDTSLGPFGAIAQTFELGTMVRVKFKYRVLTNEPVEGNNDLFSAFFIIEMGPPEPPFLEKALSDLALSAAGAEGTGYLRGMSSFASVDVKVDLDTEDEEDVTLEFLVVDSAMDAVTTKVLLDDVQVLVDEDPPLLLVRDGTRYASAQPMPLFSFAAESATFDSLLLVCCAKDGQPSSVSLTGPLLRATNSNLTATFSLLTVQPGGFFSSSSTDPLVLLEGGTYSLGSVLGVFNLEGGSTAVDPATGLTLGTDRSFQAGGELLRADQGATVETKRLVKVDTALLEATAPILHLLQGSSMKAESDLVRVGPRGSVIANVPSDALIKLNASTLTVSNGSLVNLTGGSAFSLTGNLVSLSNGSTLNILNGSLVNVSGGSVFRLTGGSLGVFGAGTNTLNITNGTPLCTGCSLTTSIPNFGGYPVLLRNGALASNVTVASGFTPFAGLNGTNTVNVNGPSGAVLAVSGSTSKVTLGP